jgi:hypothetical protein
VVPGYEARLRMKSMPEDLHKYLDAIRDDLYSAPLLVTQPTITKGVSIVDVWKAELQRKAAAWQPKPTNVAGVAEFAAACAAFAAASQISSPELRNQALALSEALVFHAELIGLNNEEI